MTINNQGIEGIESREMEFFSIPIGCPVLGDGCICIKDKVLYEKVCLTNYSSCPKYAQIESERDFSEIIRERDEIENLREAI